MEIKTYKIGEIPVALYGADSDRGYLFVHGQGGNKGEAAAFAEVAVPAGYQVLGIDLPQHGERRETKESFDPWTVAPELEAVMKECKTIWKKVSLRANSIGAYFSMLAFSDGTFDKALLVSPIVDMERLILDMMVWAGVSEEELQAKGEIPTDFGQTLSQSYLTWVRTHPVNAWKMPIYILYAGGDNMTAKTTIESFAKARNAELEIYEQGEHWFHTPEQCEKLIEWERKNI